MRLWAYAHHRCRSRAWPENGHPGVPAGARNRRTVTSQRKAQELNAEFTAGSGQPGNAAVNAIKHRGDEDGDTGMFEAAAGSGQNGIKTGEHAAGGQQIR